MTCSYKALCRKRLQPISSTSVRLFQSKVADKDVVCRVSNKMLLVMFTKRAVEDQAEWKKFEAAQRGFARHMVDTFHQMVMNAAPTSQQVHCVA